MCMSDTYIRCVYCGELHQFNAEKGIIHYEDSLRRCPVPPSNNRECFTCGEKRYYTFCRNELEKGQFKRCNKCIENGKIRRFEKYGKMLKNIGDLLMDAIRELNVIKVVQILKKERNLSNYLIPEIYDDFEVSCMGEFTMFPEKPQNSNNWPSDSLVTTWKKYGGNRYKYVHNIVFDKHGNYIPNSKDRSHKFPTTPLKLVVELAGHYKDMPRAIINLIQIAQILIQVGAYPVFAWKFWVFKYGEIDFNKEEQEFYKGVGAVIYNSFHPHK